jgi:transglutaminase-like putative cysteine protease
MRIPKKYRLKEGWSTFFLLWAMLLVASMAIFQTNLIDGLYVVSVAATAGLFTALALAKSDFKDHTAHLFALIYGLFIVGYLIGIILPGDQIWRDRIFEIASRQGAWLLKAFDGGTSRDGLIFVIQTTAVYWLLGYSAGWYTFRHPHLWRVIVPSGLVLLSVVYYYNGPRPLALYLAVYVILALLYAVRTNYNEQESHWRTAAVRYEKGSWLGFLRAGLIASVVIIMLSWSLPALSASTTLNDALSGTRGPWREFQDNWTRLFASLRTFEAGTSDPYQATMSLGGPRTPGTTLIMDIAVPRQLRSVYWQAIAYDTYENGRWIIASDTQSSLHFPDDGPVNVPLTAARENVTQMVQNYIPNTGFIYAAPELINSDKQMIIESVQDEQGNELLTATRSRYVLRQGDIYEVTSRVSTADAESLRRAGITYPEWVTARYLQVPVSVTDETKALAEEIAAPFNNPFDKTIAVRDYLRNNITYNDQIQAPPDGAEPIHHVLFETHEGYCTYYASAMAIMLRSQGIPSRVVSGYAQGEFDEETNSYRVRANNAHTWVEVYFPYYGWIQFEPTASIPTVDRPESTDGGDAFASSVTNTPPQPMDDELNTLLPDDPRADGLDLNEAQGETSGFIFPVWQAVAAVIILLIAAAIVFIAYEANKRVEGDIDRSYNRLAFWSGLLGIFYGPSDTPHERAQRMSEAVPDGRSSISKLTDEYVRKQFSGSYVVDEGFNPREEWQQLRPLLIKESIAKRFHNWMAARGG